MSGTWAEVGRFSLARPDGARRQRWGRDETQAGIDVVATSDRQVAGADQDPRGRVQVAASNSLAAGLFWTIDDGCLLVSPRLGPVIRSRRQQTRFREAWLRDTLLGTSSPHQTPYEGVHRIPPAVIATWEPGRREPSLTNLLTSLGDIPQREGPGLVEEYIRTFDACVEALLPAGETICATLSGGLDSSFVVASLVRHGPVHAFVHRPLPAAGLGPWGNWDPDDSQVAAAMADFYPGDIHLRQLVNHDLVEPLDAALAEAADTWVPEVNPGNTVWLRQARSLAGDVGSSVLFMGQNGNASFSHSHSYAFLGYLRRGELGSFISMVGNETDRGTSIYRAVGRHVARPLLGSLRSAYRQREPTSFLTTTVRPVRPARITRERFLEWMAAQPARMSLLQPGADGARIADPFRGMSLLRLAASIPATEWNRGPADRGFARRAGLGRVPDEIRLRTRRGGQAWDTWYVIRHQRDRYLDEVSSLGSTPVFEDVIDVAALEAEVLSWPWGEVPGPALGTLWHVTRLLHLAAFTRMTVQRLAHLSESAAQIEV